MGHNLHHNNKKMNKRFILKPEVAGQLGANTIIDTTTMPPIVSNLHYEFDGWLGDDLLESYPCFICTELLMHRLNKNKFTGCKFDTCEVSKSEIFNQIYQSKELPVFYWLKVIGSPKDDFYMNGNGDMIVSERVLSILKDFNINNCEIEELLPDGK